MKLKLLLASAVAVLALAGTASAATMKITEIGRDTVAGTTQFDSVGAGRLDLGTVTVGDDAEAYGRVFGTGFDDYSFTIDAGLIGSVEFVHGPLSLANGNTLVSSGLRGVEFTSPSVRFSVSGGPSTPAPVDFTGNKIGGDPVIFSGLAAGTYNFDIRGLIPITETVEGAFYDVKIAAESPMAPIPLPASALLLVGAFGGLGFAARRKNS